MNFVRETIAWLTDGAQWRGEFGIPNRLGEHIGLSLAVVVVAVAIAVPTGLVLGHLRRGGALFVNLANVGRALPSLALLILGVQLWGIGVEPAFWALLALAIPPVVTNAYVGVRGVDPDVREAALGMGMTPKQLLFRVETPLAMPLVVAGVRTAAVQVVATATLAAVVAWGGLGRFIVDGIAQRDFVQVFGGALLVAGLSLLAEGVLGMLQRILLARTHGAPVATPD